MALGLHVEWRFTRVEIVNVQFEKTVSACKVVTSVRELNFLTVLDIIQCMVVFNRVAQDVHDLYLASKSYDDVKTTRMKSNSRNFLA